MPGAPEWGTVSMIEPSHRDAGRAWVVVDAHRLDDMHPYLYETADFGHSWRRLDGGLPADVYLHAVREDPDEAGQPLRRHRAGRRLQPRRRRRAGTRSKLNLPTVAVSDLQIAGGSLVLGTNGRSVWIFDDLALLRQLTPETTAGDVHLFASPEAVRWEIADAHRGNVWTGDNPPHGARLYYFLKDEPKGEVKVEIRDAQGALVTTLSSEPGKPPGASEDAAGEEEALKKLALPKEAGINRATWNLTWAGAELIQGGILDAGDPSVGPAALPGTYTARLTVGDHTETTTLVVEADPRETVADADRAAQLRYCLALRDAITRLTRTVDRLRAVRTQLTDRNDLLAADAAAEHRAAAHRRQRADRQARRPRGPAPQPEGHRRLRHPGDARRRPALLAPLAAPRRRRGRRRRAHPGAARGLRGRGGRAGGRRRRAGSAPHRRPGGAQPPGRSDSACPRSGRRRRRPAADGPVGTMRLDADGEPGGRGAAREAGRGPISARLSKRGGPRRTGRPRGAIPGGCGRPPRAPVLAPATTPPPPAAATPTLTRGASVEAASPAASSEPTRSPGRRAVPADRRRRRPPATSPSAWPRRMARSSRRPTPPTSRGSPSGSPR